jgi:hypothetical protein
VVVGEYNGPTLFELPQLDAVLQETMASAFAGDDVGALGTSELTARATTETPERRAMKALYAAMAELPAPLQMFMAGCPPELEARRHRINCREIVTRNLFALSAGVRRTVCWHLAPEVPHYEDPFTLMELMHGKLPLLGYDGDRLGRRRPAANAFHRLASYLDGAVSVTRVEHDGDPGLFAFTVERAGRGELIVLWKDGDVFSGEVQPPALVDRPRPFEAAFAVDACGDPQPVALHAGRLQLAVSVTPIFVAPEPLDQHQPPWPADPNASRAAVA